MRITDSFGRVTEFEGKRLVTESTDSFDGRKPQWAEIDVWVTKGGNFVVKRATVYRIRHLTDNCTRADGYELTRATPSDDYPCGTCNKNGLVEGTGWAQLPRVSVESYRSPLQLIDSFASRDGSYTNLARAVLAELADQDERINELWNKVTVP